MGVRAEGERREGEVGGGGGGKGGKGGRERGIKNGGRNVTHTCTRILHIVSTAAKVYMYMWHTYIWDRSS